MTLADQLRAEGEAGGEAKVKRKTAVAFLKAGSDPDFVSHVMGFTLKELKALREQEAEFVSS